MILDRRLHLVGSGTGIGTHAALRHNARELTVIQSGHHDLHRRTLGNTLHVVLGHGDLHLHATDADQLHNRDTRTCHLTHLGILRGNIATERSHESSVGQRLLRHRLRRLGRLQLVLNLNPLHLGQRPCVVQFLHTVIRILRLLQRRLRDGVGMLQRRGIQFSNQLSGTHRLSGTHQDPLDRTRHCKRQRRAASLLNRT